VGNIPSSPPEYDNMYDEMNGTGMPLGRWNRGMMSENRGTERIEKILGISLSTI
jgi:hypothetical protein